MCIRDRLSISMLKFTSYSILRLSLIYLNSVVLSVESIVYCMISGIYLKESIYLSILLIDFSITKLL